jgi:hypothetical protein
MRWDDKYKKDVEIKRHNRMPIAYKIDKSEVTKFRKSAFEMLKGVKRLFILHVDTKHIITISSQNNL